jgi:hypothetical protein
MAVMARRLLQPVPAILLGLMLHKLLRHSTPPANLAAGLGTPILWPQNPDARSSVNRCFCLHFLGLRKL